MLAKCFIKSLRPVICHKRILIFSFSFSVSLFPFFSFGSTSYSPFSFFWYLIYAILRLPLSISFSSLLQNGFKAGIEIKYCKDNKLMMTKKKGMDPSNELGIQKIKPKYPGPPHIQNAWNP